MSEHRPSRRERAQAAGNYLTPVRPATPLAVKVVAVIGTYLVVSMLLMTLGLAGYIALTLLTVLGLAVGLPIFLLRSLLRMGQGAEASVGRYWAQWRTTRPADEPGPIRDDELLMAAGSREPLGGGRPGAQRNALTSLWQKFGKALIMREAELQALAAAHGSGIDPVSHPDELNPLLDATDGFELWQVRNRFLLTDPGTDSDDVTIQVADLNTYQWAQTYVANVIPSTVIEAWFPADHVLVATPRKPTSLHLPWASGAAVGANEPLFLEHFTVRSDNEAWARLLLTPDVMSRLIAAASGDAARAVSLLVNNGRITLVTTRCWLTPERILEFADLLRDIVAAAKAAQA